MNFKGSVLLTFSRGDVKRLCNDSGRPKRHGIAGPREAF